ncbi:MAG: S41 family peptidase [bacterium]|nr:S41 family peptidase [bacterium]
MKGVLCLKSKIWIAIAAFILISLVAVLIWQSDKWYALYTEMSLRVLKELKGGEIKPSEKLARYDNLLFESDLTSEQHSKINGLARSFKQILILFELKSIKDSDVEDFSQEMFAAERSPYGRDKYSRYQSRTGLREEKDTDSSLVGTPPPKIIFSGVDTIALIKIPSFSPELPDNLKRDLDVVTQFGVNKFVIDLRNDPGGIDESAILILGFFMRQDDIICTRRGRDRETIYNRKYLIKTLKALDVGRYKHLRQIVLLVNRNTASAAEIFAGVMQEWDYVLIGEKTFGKGVGQEYFSLPAPAGSVFILTTREYLIGKGRKKLDGVGVTPDILVRNLKSKKSPDFQMEAAIKFLQNNPHRN